MDTYHRIIDFKLGGPALLLHCDTAKDSASSWDSRWYNYTPDIFIDSSPHAHVINRLDLYDPPYQHRNPMIVSGGRFGSCIRADGEIFWEHHDAFNFGVDDFTIDFRGKADALNDWYWGDKGGSLTLQLRYPMIGAILNFGFHDYTLRSYYEMLPYAPGEYDPDWFAKMRCWIEVPHDPPIDPPVMFMGTTRLLAQRWYHFALVRQADVLYFYLDGQLEGSAPLGIWTNFTSPEKDPEPPAFVWRDDYHGVKLAASWDDYVYIDELRITKGAKWTENFTPPTEPYSG